METNNGGLNFQAVIDIEQLKRDMARMKAEFEGMTKKAQKEGNKTQQIVNKMLKGATAYLTIQQARNFANQVIQIRGQFQQLNVAFETMLGNKAKADALMSQVVDFASKTPFQLTEVAGGTKQLLAYRIEQEKIIPTLKALGDVSAGLSVPIGRLILNYGQVKTASKLTGRELRDFNMAGVPLIAELSKNLNKSETDIQAMVSAGKIGFKEVEEAFRTMTSEGGRFADLMDKQSGTITGKISNLYDAIDKMFNDIGKANEGVINSAIDGAGYLVEHYEEVGKILGELIATYGVYKASLITVTAIDKTRIAYMKIYNHELKYQTWLAMTSEKVTRKKAKAMALEIMSHKSLTKALIRQRIAQLKANLATMANPYVLAGVAVASLAYAVYKLATAQTVQEKAQERLNERIKEQREQAEAERNELRELVDVIKDEVSTRTEKQRALDVLQQKYPSLFGNMDIESIKTVSLTKKIKEQKEEQEALNRVKLEDAINDNKKRISDEKSSPSKPIFSKNGRIIGYEVYTAEIERLEADNKLLQKEIDKYDSLKDKSDFKALKPAGKIRVTEEKNRILKERLRLVREQEKEELKTSPFSTKTYEKDAIEKQILQNKQLIKKYNDEIKKARKNTKTANQEVSEWTKKIANLKKERDSINKGDLSTSDRNKKLKKVDEEIKSLEKLIKLRNPNYGKKGAKTSKPKFNQEEYDLQNKRKLEDLEHQKQQGIIDAMQEGLDKQYKQLKLDADRKLQLLERNKQDEIQRIKDAEKQKQEAQGKSYDATQGNKRIKEVEGAFKNLIQTQVEQSKKTQDDFLKSTLNKYLTYEQQKTEINNRFNAERRVLEGEDEGKKNAENIKLLEKARQKELFELEKTAQGTKSVIAQLFGDTTQMTEQQMSNLIDKAEDFIKSIKPTPENIEKIKAIREQIDKLKKTLDETETGFSRMGKNIDKIFKKGTSNQERLKALNELSSDLQNASALANMFGDSLKAIGELSGNELFGDIAEGISTITEVAGKTMEGAKTGMALGGTAGAIVGGALGFVSSVLGKIASAEKKHREALKKVRLSEMQSQQQYNQLLFEQKMLMKDAESIFGVDALAKGLGYLDAYNQSFEKLQSKLKKTEKELSINLFGKDYKLGIKSFTSELSRIMVKTGHKKTGLFGWGKGKDIYSSVTEVYKDLINKEGELNVARAKSILQNREMSQEDRVRLQGIINLYEQTQEAQKQFDNYLKETFGELGSGLMDSVINSLKTGEDAFKTFSKSVGNILGNLGKQLIENLFITSKFKQLQKDIENVYRKGQKDSLSKEDIAKNVRSLVVGFANNVKGDIGLMQDFAKTWQEETKELGYDVWGAEKDKKREAVQKGFASMTQDQASGLDSKFTLSTELQKQGILLSKDISTSMKMLQSTSARQLKHLSGIEVNTHTLHQMKSDIGAMKSNIEDINDKGIKLRKR